VKKSKSINGFCRKCWVKQNPDKKNEYDRLLEDKLKAG
ncbi:unnamed protein product, partial [marine sediment metagenome]